jgi:hypothetical protein
VRDLPPNPLAEDAGLRDIGRRIYGPERAVTGDQLTRQEGQTEQEMLDRNYGRTLRAVSQGVNPEIFSEHIMTRPEEPGVAAAWNRVSQQPLPPPAVMSLQEARDLMSGKAPPQRASPESQDDRFGMPSSRAPFLAGATPNTQLPLLDEMAFRQWAKDNQVRFNPDAAQSDYDMRGFYRGLTQGDPRASSAVNPNDQRMHYPDYWKTPLHPSFSSESQWAGPGAPSWNQQDQLVSPGGRIVVDERRQPTLADILFSTRQR